MGELSSYPLGFSNSGVRGLEVIHHISERLIALLNLRIELNAACRRACLALKLVVNAAGPAQRGSRVLKPAELLLCELQVCLDLENAASGHCVSVEHNISIWPRDLLPKLLIIPNNSANGARHPARAHHPL